jgi:hypothetical protein
MASKPEGKKLKFFCLEFDSIKKTVGINKFSEIPKHKTNIKISCISVYQQQII